MGTGSAGLSLSPEAPSPASVRRIAGFWARLVALLIDVIALAIPGFILGFLFNNFFSYSNARGSLVGMGMILAYFSVMGSSLGGGQTVGQRFMGIQVVKRDGTLLPIGKSMLRYLILFGPFLLTSFSNAMPMAAGIGFNALLTIAAGATIYLYIFNTRTRQSLHDLATDAFVVDVPGGPVAPRPFWMGHWAIVASAVVAAIALNLILMPKSTGTFADLMSIQRAVLQSGMVQTAGVQVQVKGGQSVTRSGVRIEVTCRGTLENYEKTAMAIAAIVLKTDRHAAERDYISVVFLKGFNVGFARFSRNYTVTHSPGEWNKLIEQSGST